MDSYKEKRYTLSKDIFVEPATRQLRPALVKFITLLLVRAKRLSKEELYGTEGADISSAICGALAWQGANGVKGDDWITEKDEPLLFELLNVSGALDIDNNQPEKWVQLFEIASHIDT